MLSRTRGSSLENLLHIVLHKELRKRQLSAKAQQRSFLLLYRSAKRANFRGVTERPVRPGPSSEASTLLGKFLSSVWATVSLQANAALAADPHQHCLRPLLTDTLHQQRAYAADYNQHGHCHEYWTKNVQDENISIPIFVECDNTYQSQVCVKNSGVSLWVLSDGL